MSIAFVSDPDEGKKKKKGAIALNRITKISKEMCINEIKWEYCQEKTVLIIS